jgi:hypothetical protein
MLLIERQMQSVGATLIVVTVDIILLLRSEAVHIFCSDNWQLPQGSGYCSKNHACCCTSSCLPYLVWNLLSVIFCWPLKHSVEFAVMFVDPAESLRRYWRPPQVFHRNRHHPGSWPYASSDSSGLSNTKLTCIRFSSCWVHLKSTFILLALTSPRPLIKGCYSLSPACILPHIITSYFWLQSCPKISRSI